MAGTPSGASVSQYLLQRLFPWKKYSYTIIQLYNNIDEVACRRRRQAILPYFFKKYLKAFPEPLFEMLKHIIG